MFAAVVRSHDKGRTHGDIFLHHEQEITTAQPPCRIVVVEEMGGWAGHARCATHNVEVAFAYGSRVVRGLYSPTTCVDGSLKSGQAS